MSASTQEQCASEVSPRQSAQQLRRAEDPDARRGRTGSARPSARRRFGTRLRVPRAKCLARRQGGRSLSEDQFRVAASLLTLRRVRRAPRNVSSSAVAIRSTSAPWTGIAVGHDRTRSPRPIGAAMVERQLQVPLPHLPRRPGRHAREREQRLAIGRAERAPAGRAPRRRDRSRSREHDLGVDLERRRNVPAALAGARGDEGARGSRRGAPRRCSSRRRRRVRRTWSGASEQAASAS